MKKLCAVLIFAFAAFLSVQAQVVNVEIALNQDQFLPGETLPVTVRIYNSSGQTLHLGADANWLTFSVQSVDNNSGVARMSQPTVAGAFDLASSDVAIKRVDIAPYFNLKNTGHYRVIATVHIPGWDTDISSNAKEFDIVSGAEIWSQEFGLPMPAGISNRPPEIRKYVLEEANYLRKQLRMYVLVSDDSGEHIYKVNSIGAMVSFSRPEAQLDSASDLHVLYQGGAQTFLYSVINPDGEITQQEIYDYANSRPHLGLDSNGHIIVVGGAKRTKPQDLPLIVPPTQLPAPAK